MSLVTAPFRPKAVPAGKRVAQSARKAHKDRPKVGRGQYVKAPLLRDKVTKPRWQVNALLNNPGNILATGAVAGGTGYLLPHKKVEKQDKKRDAVAGGAIGAGGAHFARVGAGYGAKAVAERQFKPLTNKGNYGPYKEGPHKGTLNRYKRTLHGDVRAKAKMFDQNFPKHLPSYRARKVLVGLDKKPVIAGIVGGGAAIGAGASLVHDRKRVSKMVSAFGVDHGS